MAERDDELHPDAAEDDRAVRPVDDENLVEVDDAAEDERLHDLDAAERRGMGKGAMVVIGIIVLALLAAGALLLVFNPFASTPAPDNTAPVTSLPAPSIGPTESLPVSSPTVVPPPTGPATTPPDAKPTGGDGRALALNRWNWLADQRLFSVGGFIPGTESGGTCTLTAAHGGVTLVASAPAEADASTTVCVVNLAAPDAEAGQWELTMSYDGPGGPATSETVVVTV